MISAAVTVTTSPTLILAADDLTRNVYIHNSGGAKIYLGGSTVTTGTGYHLANAESLSIVVPERETIYAIVASGTNTITVLHPNSD